MVIRLDWRVEEMEQGGYVYIMTNKYNRVLYVGVTASLSKRVDEHKSKIDPWSFTSKYNVVKLVYYTHFASIEDAIAEEKRIKGGSRNKKLALIEAMNPEWKDLTDEIF